MRLKIRKGKIHVHGLRLVDQTDVLVCARLAKSTPRKQMAEAVYQFHKYGFLEECRMLGYEDENDYMLVANLLEQDHADRFLENLRRNPVKGLVMCETPSDAAKRVKPVGNVIPSDVAKEEIRLLSQDPDIVQSYVQGIADRMDLDPDGDYVFGNLPPEMYEAVKDLRKKKPQ